MSAQSPSARPRPGGGFNSGFGNFSDEHLDENAVQQAMTQKMMGQQQAAGAGSPQGVPAGSANPLAGTPPGSPPPPPREVGSLYEELIKRPIVDIGKSLLSILDFSDALGISPPQDKTPEEQARMQAMHQRYQKLNEEQRQFAQRKYQEDLQKKKQAEQEKQQREAQRRQQEAASVAMPSSPKKGPVGPAGSSKQRAVTKLEQDRKTLGGPASAN
jgi:hypothetical protein